MSKGAKGQSTIARRKHRGLDVVKAPLVSDAAWDRVTATPEIAAGDDVLTPATDGQQDVAEQHLVADAKGSV